MICHALFLSTTPLFQVHCHAALDTPLFHYIRNDKCQVVHIDFKCLVPGVEIKLLWKVLNLSDVNCLLDPSNCASYTFIYHFVIHTVS